MSPSFKSPPRLGDLGGSLNINKPLKIHKRGEIRLAEQTFFYGVGRRKTSTARVRIVPGTGQITIDGKTLEERFPQKERRRDILMPFQIIDAQNKFDAAVQVLGGGVTGQAQAIRHGIARAFVAMDEKLKPALRKAGLLTRDPRVKERKKYGLKRARKAPQYTKR